jgi:hypothetical protein
MVFITVKTNMKQVLNTYLIQVKAYLNMYILHNLLLKITTLSMPRFSVKRNFFLCYIFMELYKFSLADVGKIYLKKPRDERTNLFYNSVLDQRYTRKKARVLNKISSL